MSEKEIILIIGIVQTIINIYLVTKLKLIEDNIELNNISIKTILHYIIKGL